MKLVNKFSLTILLNMLFITAYSQISSEAWENYDNSKYDANINNKNSDAIIIYNRTYFYTKKDYELLLHDKVIIFKTVHRKIKLNSLYALEKFNKLYISTIEDLHYNIELVDCKAKTLKNNQTITTEASQFVETTLPANTPFYYKKKGKVKMLALNDVAIGDQIEYIYTVKQTYDVSYEHFYTTNRVSFSSNNYCMEKSCFFESNYFETNIYPYNFNNGNTINTDYAYKSGQKISLTNINQKPNELFVNNGLNEPYIYYEIARKEPGSKKETWGDLAKYFKPKRKDIKGNTIFDGEGIMKAFESMKSIKGTLNKFEFLLKKINKPLEENYFQYYRYEDNIDISLAYAKNISKLMEALDVAVDFNFVVDKNYGVFDTSYTSIYQFDNILISFKDADGKKHYMPLLEPYLKIDEIKLKFQDTECFTISQSALGKRTFSYDKIPLLNTTNYYSKNVSINLKDKKEDSMFFEVTDSLIFVGEPWLNIKPAIHHFIKDSSYTEKLFKAFAKGQLISPIKIDSVYNVKFSIDSPGFSLSYNYIFKQILNSNSNIINFKPEQFVENYFFTPYNQRKQRIAPGYLYDEFDIKHSINFKFNNQLKWIENLLINNKFDITLGSLETSYKTSNSNLDLFFNLHYKAYSFTKKEWPEMLELRDNAFDYLHSNLYFQVIE